MIGGARAFLLNGFDDAELDGRLWDDLLHRGDTDVVYLTREWQRVWWERLGQGTLLLVAAEHAGRVVALAPMYAQEGMVFFAGSGDADYLDFIGDIDAPDVLEAILTVASAAAPGFCGMRLFGVPEASGTGRRLCAAATRLGWWCYCRDRSPATRLDLIAGRAHAELAADGPKVSKRERYFSRLGSLELREFGQPDEIRQHLPALFEQHTARWAEKGVESRFADASHQRFLHDLIRCAGAAFTPRLTCLEWQGRAIACEFAWIYRDIYFAVASSFAPDLALRSPGQVLQRRIVLAVLRDGLAAYDFGEGDYPYKLKYATEVGHVETWELVPVPASEASGNKVDPC
jgi:CelD/BcsL family acetyltransferase involved in cellulose biosynthesis